MTIVGPINTAIVDAPWSLIHFISGFIIGTAVALLDRPRRWGRKVVTGVSVLVAWEAIEITLHQLDLHAPGAVTWLKAAVHGYFFAPESAANVTGDLVIGTLGLLMGVKLFHRPRPRVTVTRQHDFP